MLRNLAIAACIAVLHIIPASLFSQCLIPPPLDSCNGTEPALLDNEIVGIGVKKWFYGTATTYNSITLRGGTLVVCGNLTFTNFTMDSGTIVIRPGAHLRIGGGAGIVLRGHSYIYNYGIFECTSNLSLDPTWATPAKPNVVINATATSFFKMSNQYFTINNANSFFVNRGRADFWGLITDYGAGAGSVCLGRYSEVNMAVLYNNRRHTYIAPEGAACVRVWQYSQFRDTLTNSMNINICLGATHNSDASCIPWGCRPNAWGTPNIFQFCDMCNGLQLLRKQDNPGRPVVNTTELRDGELLISPNPFLARLTLKWKGTAPVSVQLVSLSGAIVFNRRLTSLATNALEIQLPVSMAPGKYFVKLIYENRVEVRQVVKMN
jgi:hypothetical protein